MVIGFILLRKNGGHRWNVQEGLSHTLKMCQTRGSKNKSKML